MHRIPELLREFLPGTQAAWKAGTGISRMPTEAAILRTVYAFLPPPMEIAASPPRASPGGVDVKPLSRSGVRLEQPQISPAVPVRPRGRHPPVAHGKSPTDPDFTR